jgi:glycosyltransferase involved in cell wall biosynthesis
MKRILFHYPVLNVGGAEMSTLRLLGALADRGWNVTLVLTTGGGALEAAVDPRVRLVRLRPVALGNRFAAARGMARVAALPDLLGYALMRIIGALRMMPFLFRRYAAAAVLLHSTSPFFVARMVRAGTKMQWIRTDLKGIDDDGRMASSIGKYLNKIRWYVCVSETARVSLGAAVPGAREKAVVIYNVLDTAQMRRKLSLAADPYSEASRGLLRILTVCRLQDRDKAIFRMARVCRTLVDAGHRFVWYVVGAGSDRGGLEVMISELGLGQHMVLLGEMSDPFPAYKYADLVAVLSYREGLCGVINEAKVSGCAVLTTRVSGVEEQLTHGRNGWIVENDEESIVAGLADLISNADMLARLKNDDFPPAILDDDHKLLSLERLIDADSYNIRVT